MERPQSSDPDAQTVVREVDRRIAEGVVTADDFNRLIENTYKSAQERVRRLAEPLDHNREHDDEGHSRFNRLPSPAARLAPRRGGGTKNDPRRTGRGRAMLKRQELRNEEVDRRVPKIAEEWYWPTGNPRTRILLVSQVSRIAQQYGTSFMEAAGLLDQAHRHLGIGLNGGGSSYDACMRWFKTHGKPTNVQLEERQGPLPEARFETVLNYNPICPHCGEVMYEKHFVPDYDHDNGILHEGYRHRGPCYDKGPFLIHWPKQENQQSLGEAERFVLAHMGRAVTESALTKVQDKDALRKLLSRLMTSSPVRRDWAYPVYRALLVEKASIQKVGAAVGKLGASLKQIGQHSKEEALALAKFFKNPSAEVWDAEGRHIVLRMAQKLAKTVGDKMQDPKELAEWAELAGVPGSLLVASLFDIPDALSRRSMLRKWDIPDAKTKALKALLGPRGFTAILNVFVKYPNVRNRMIKLLLSSADESTEGAEELTGAGIARRKF